MNQWLGEFDLLGSNLSLYAANKSSLLIRAAVSKLFSEPQQPLIGIKIEGEWSRRIRIERRGAIIKPRMIGATRRDTKGQHAKKRLQVIQLRFRILCKREDMAQLQPPRLR